MAYGKRRRSRKGSSKRGSYAFKKAKRSQKRRSKPYTKQIQSSSFLPASRLVRFAETKTFTVSQFTTPTATQHVPISWSFPANDPATCWLSGVGTVRDGEWLPHDLSVTTPVPYIRNLKSWITEANGNPVVGSRGVYRTGAVKSLKITVTAQPEAQNPANQDTYQDSMMCFLQNTTGTRTEWAGRNQYLSGANNGQVRAKEHYTTQGTTYTNPNGTPRGCTLTKTYNFKKFNRTPGREFANTFNMDKEPEEKDTITFSMYPGNAPAAFNADSSGAYSLMPPHIVTVKMEYIVQLSEPDTLKQSDNTNMGNDLPTIPTGSGGD